MIAKLLAWLGLDTKNFHIGIDGVKRKAGGLGTAFKGLNNIIKAALPLALFHQISARIDSIIQKSKETGDFKFISKESVERLEEVKGIFETIKNTVAGNLGTTKAWIAGMVQEAAGFWGAFTAGSSVDESSRVAINNKKVEDPITIAKREAAAKDAFNKQIAENNAAVMQEIEEKNLKAREQYAKDAWEEEKRLVAEFLDEKARLEKEAAEKKEALIEQTKSAQEKALDEERKGVETNIALSEKALDQQITALEKESRAQRDAAAESKELALSKSARQALEAKQKFEVKQESRFQKLLNKADEKMGQGRKLNKAEEFAVKAREQMADAAAKQKEMEDLQKQHNAYLADQVRILENIETNTANLGLG